MTVAVQISGAVMDEERQLKQAIFFCNALAVSNPGLKACFIFNHPNISNNAQESGYQNICITPSATNNLLLYFWYQFKLTAELHKMNTTLFISSGPCCSLRSTTRSVICLDWPDLHNRNKRYLKKILPKFINQSILIQVPNDLVQEQVLHQYPLAEEKIAIIPTGFCLPLTANTEGSMAEIKNELTGGKEYFLYEARCGTIEDCITQLKAFSHFKKWQQSNFRLVLIVSEEQHKAISVKLATYKYKIAVHLLLSEEKDHSKILYAAAYTVLLMPSNLGVNPYIIHILESGAPLVLPDHPYYRSSFGAAVHYTAPDEKGVSQAMILMYKNEDTRNSLLQHAAEKMKEHSLENSSWKLAEAILKT
jgi:hypothetical protein